jgi:hypothetical protein
MQLSPLEPARPPLAAHADALGYLYLPGLLPVAPIERLRRRVLEVAAPLGWLAPGARFGTFDDPAWLGFQNTMLTDPAFRALGAEPALLEVARELGGGRAAPTLAATCRVVSAWAPDLTVPPHQDAHFVPRFERMWTAWIPLDDCPLARGPLAVLPGSHREGLRPHTEPWHGGLSITVPPDRVWASGDLAVGDVIFFERLTVHRMVVNRSDLPRLSADYRFALGVDSAV